MNIFGKNVVDTCTLITENAECEDCYVDSIFDQSLLDQFVDTFACLESVSESCYSYTNPQLVPVLAQNEEFYVELDCLAKVAEANEIDIYEALEMVAECNDLPMSSMNIVVESDEYIGMLIAEAKAAKGSKLEKSKAKGLQATVDAIEDLKEKGVKLVKKSSGKKKKSKKCDD